MPRVAETVDKVVIVEWLVEEGDQVKAGDALFRVETDKAEVEVPSPLSGVVLQRLVGIDQDVSTGSAVADIES